MRRSASAQTPLSAQTFHSTPLLSPSTHLVSEAVLLGSDKVGEEHNVSSVVRLGGGVLGAVADGSVGAAAGGKVSLEVAL